MHTSVFEVGTGDTVSERKANPTMQYKNTSEHTNLNSIIWGNYPNTVCSLNMYQMLAIEYLFNTSRIFMTTWVNVNVISLI